MDLVCNQTEVFEKMKRVLVISYFFPPMGGVGVQRVLKFVKYLPHFGWLSTVLTLRRPDCKLFDQELLKEIPVQTRVIRTHTIEPSKLHHFLVSLANRLADSRKTEKPAGKIVFDVTPKDRLDTKINNFFFIPDNRIGWVPFAFLAMLRKCKKVKFDVIFSTSPPFSVHLAGLIAKFVSKKPWVVDLRDLWFLHPHKKHATRIHSRISKYIEHTVLKRADKILTVSEPLSEDLKKTYPDIASGKFEVIPNGYDQDDLEAKNNVTQNNTFSIGHIGSLQMHSGRTPYHFLMALIELKKEVPEFVNEMRVFFVGVIDRPNKEFLNKMIIRFDLKNTVHCIDFVSHRQAIKHMKNSSVLLFLIVKSAKDCGSSRGNVSGKLYEYFATGKPILALTEEGPIRDLIKKSGCGILVDYDDTQKIKKEILNCFSKFKEGQLRTKPNWDLITRFERKKLTEQLASILNELSESTTRRRSCGISENTGIKS
jgi:glycosyltransferase involved in cell wall biosynthesis